MKFLNKQYQDLSESELCLLAKDFANEISIPSVVCLYGDLGAGKSIFCRTIIQTLMMDDQYHVPSPTFTLVQEYDSNKGGVAHFDCYRLQNSMDLIELNYYELITSHLCLIEWPEIIQDILPVDYIHIDIKKKDDDKRDVFITHIFE